jgi:mRNA interferase MazF
LSKTRYAPRRGDVIKLDFDPRAGHEQAERRPAIVLSPSEYNRRVGLVVVCPITNEEKGFPWEVKIPDNDFVSGVVLADQVKSLDWKDRRAEFLCTPEEGLLEDVVEKCVALISPEDEDE